MPHSWEIVQQRNNSCLIAIVAPPSGVSMDWSLSWGNMEKPPLWDVMRLSGLPWDVARTQAAIQCLNGGYQFLFFLDSDVLAPKDTIPRLLAHRLPIVSGLYHQRFPTWTGITGDYLPCMFNEVVGADSKLTKQAIVDYKPGSLVEAAYVPGGCLLVHRSVFERLTQAGIKRFFEWTLQVDAEPPGTGRSEDFEFCLPEGAMVYGYNVKPIEQIEVGDRVLTHKGTLKPVTKTFKRRYNGELVSIKPILGSAVTLTPEHPILAKTKEPKCIQRVSQWTAAKNIKKGDWIFLPDASRNWLSISRLNLDKYVSAKNAKRENGLIYYNRTHKTAPRIPLNIDMSPDLLRLFGYYIAEGSPGAKKCSVEFSFGKEETDLIEDTQQLLKEIFRVHGSICPNGSVTKVVASSKILAHLFTNLCGHTAKNKILPRFFYELDDGQLGQLIKGYWLGDGRKDGFTATTVSRRLAHQLKLALLRLRILASVYPTQAGAYGIDVNQAYRADFSQKMGIGNGRNGRNSNRSFKRVEHLKVGKTASAHGGFWIKVHSVTKVPYDGFVYNLAVKTNESYVAEGASMHNCARARSIGFKCFVDTSIIATHETGAQVGAKGLLPKL